MNNISQISIFDYREIENLGDLERLKIFFEKRVFTGFLNKLKNCKEEIEEIFKKLVKFMYENLKGFGEDCAIDGKFLDTYAKPYEKEKCKDNRADHEAGEVYYIVDLNK